jgi:hypothetical protein
MRVDCTHTGRTRASTSGSGSEQIRFHRINPRLTAAVGGLAPTRIASGCDTGPNRTSVLARPTGFNRADAINLRIPIGEADISLVAAGVIGVRARLGGSSSDCPKGCRAASYGRRRRRSYPGRPASRVSSRPPGGPRSRSAIALGRAEMRRWVSAVLSVSGPIAVLRPTFAGRSVVRRSTARDAEPCAKPQRRAHDPVKRARW